MKRGIAKDNQDLSLFKGQPQWEFREHAQDIVDISWAQST